MADSNHGHWLSRDLAAQREGYLLRYVSAVLALALLGFGLWRGQAVVAGAGLLLLLLTAVWLGLQIWTGQRLAFARAQSSRKLRQMSRLQPIDRILSVDLGNHEAALQIGRELTTGRLTIVNVFNPLLAPHAAAGQTRRDAARFADDPRLAWYNGSVNLLPLPDHSVRIAVLDHVLSELVQEGDRQALLREVRRVLEPNGRVLLAELADSWPVRLRAFLGGTDLQPLSYWRSLLQGAGLQVTEEQQDQGLIVYLRADNITPYTAHQLALDLGL